MDAGVDTSRTKRQINEMPRDVEQALDTRGLTGSQDASRRFWHDTRTFGDIAIQREVP